METTNTTAMKRTEIALLGEAKQMIINMYTHGYRHELYKLNGMTNRQCESLITKINKVLYE